MFILILNGYFFIQESNFQVYYTEFSVKQNKHNIVIENRLILITNNN
jgi:hypothetical protein